MSIENIDDWISAHARLPNRSVRRKIRAYTTAGVCHQADEYEVVLGREVEKVTAPLFGHPKIGGQDATNPHYWHDR